MSRPEGFVDIEGFEGRYAVHRDGRIYCYPKDRGLRGVKAERIMKPYIKPNGYVNAQLIAADGTRVWKMVHRIVAKTFIKNPSGHRCINHKNGIKTDNRVENLEWCTYSHNHKHAYRVLGRRGPLAGKKKIGGKYVTVYN